MKLSFKIPTWLFLIVIVLLVLFILYKICNSSEGFVNYNSGATSASEHQLPGTDVSGMFLYDNNYFYPGSGKVVRVWGQEKVDTSVGASHDPLEDIHSYTVFDRNGNNEIIDVSIVRLGESPNYTKDYILDSSVNVAGNRSDLSALYNHWYTKTVPSEYTSYANNQLFYVNYGYVTYIHVIDNNATGANNFGYLQSNDTLSTVTFGEPMDIDYVSSSSFTAGAANDVEVGGKTLIDCYKVANNVYYNINNGDLYIDESSVDQNTLAIYDRSDGGKKLDATENADYVFPNDKNLDSNNSTRFIAKDIKGGNLVVYIAKQSSTLILVLHKEDSGSSDGVYSLGSNSVFRFEQNGLVPFESESESGESGSSSDESGSSSSSSSDESSSSSDESSSDSPPAPDGSGNMNEYWKWYWYWNSNNTPMGGFSNDYMLKTQMVPPVCPACPACPTGGDCTNCGGHGGSGTVDEAGNSVVKSSNLSGVLDTTVTTTGDVAGKVLDTGTSALNKTLDTTSDLLKSAGSGALGLTNTVLDGAGNLVQGTGQLARDTASGTVDLARETVSGTADFVQDAASGTADFVKDMGRGQHSTNGTYGYGSNNTSGYYQQHGQLTGGQQNNYLSPAMDPYTYNGQLSQKPESDYIPLTNSFSAFGK
jgi:hypothetical protein